MTVLATKHRTPTHTEVHRCRSCRRAFWGRRDWNRVNVQCPHCGSLN